jgi:hypothetical protein
VLGERSEPGEAGAEGHRLGKLLSPERRRHAVFHAQQKHGLSERAACRLVSQPRGTQRYQPTQREDEDQLTRATIALARQYGRYGYRRITALLKHAGWQVGKDRVERIWRREGLKVPQKQKPRGRLWLNHGSYVRLRPTHANHVWSYDFVSDGWCTGMNLCPDVAEVVGAEYEATFISISLLIKHTCRNQCRVAMCRSKILRNSCSAGPFVIWVAGLKTETEPGFPTRRPISTGTRASSLPVRRSGVANQR